MDRQLNCDEKQRSKMNLQINVGYRFFDWATGKVDSRIDPKTYRNEYMSNVITDKKGRNIQ